MAYISKRNRRLDRERYNACMNRREIVAAQLSRREMVKMGLLTSAGVLVAKNGLSVRGQTVATGPVQDAALQDPNAESFGQTGQCVSPATTPFVEDFVRMTVKQPETQPLFPTPTVAPNNAAGEGRTRNHQVVTSPFPPTKQYRIVQQENSNVIISPQLDPQTMWTFDGLVPGPVYHAFYGEPILVRNVNNLPLDNGGFGNREVTTHLHNGHTPSESDGFPCDYFPNSQNPVIANAFFYDHYYPNILAGFASTHPPNGDPNESMSTLWYHDHRVDFTAQNVYKGLAGMYLLFNDKDNNDETNPGGFQLPSGEFDVPMMLADRCVDPVTGQLFFDLFNFDGILGDKFLVNGKIQPVLHVHPRKYRFRWLNSGPSRFYQIFLTRINPTQTKQFWHIANDGNLLPAPIQVTSAKLGVAERMDVIIDFSTMAGQTVYMENRLVQNNGRGPECQLTQAGQGTRLVKIIVDLPSVPDPSTNPATAVFYPLPNKTAPPLVSRTFTFQLTQNGQWVINGQFMNCDVTRFKVKQNSVENWTFRNTQTDRPSWAHPIHIHFEEFQFLQGGFNQECFNAPPSSVENSRKDVVRLNANSERRLFFRFRDFLGRYPIHCHNVVHEDHAMMLRFEIDPTGDTNPNP